MSKILVAYFSASGVTARAAEEIAQAVGGDLYEIRPAQPYTAADLDWTNKQSRSSLEMTDPACRPAVAGAVADMARYETVFVGFPIWWGGGAPGGGHLSGGVRLRRKGHDPLRHLRRQRHALCPAASAQPVSGAGLARGQAGPPRRGGVGPVRPGAVRPPCPRVPRSWSAPERTRSSAPAPASTRP